MSWILNLGHQYLFISCATNAPCFSSPGRYSTGSWSSGHTHLPKKFNREYPFATIAYTQSQQICHFCKMISGVSASYGNLEGVSGQENLITLKPHGKQGLRGDKVWLKVAVLVGDDASRRRILLGSNKAGCKSWILINSYEGKGFLREASWFH